MNKILMGVLVSLFAGFMKKSSSDQQAYKDIALLKMTVLYLKSVETFRLVCISVLCISSCVIFFITSIVLFHTSLFLYAPWRAEDKMLFGFLSAAFYLLTAVAVCFYIFNPERWLKIFHAHRIVDQLSRHSFLDRQEDSNGTRHSSSTTKKTKDA